MFSLLVFAVFVFGFVSAVSASCASNFSCSWSDCNGGVQYQTCTDLNNCTAPQITGNRTCSGSCSLSMAGSSTSGQNNQTTINPYIQVFYATEFTAYPSSSSGSTWISKIAGGNNKPINVLYGVMARDAIYYPADGSICRKILDPYEFIKISGAGGSYNQEGGTNFSDSNFLVSRFSSNLGQPTTKQEVVNGQTVYELIPSGISGLINLTRYLNLEKNLVNLTLSAKESDALGSNETFYTIDMDSLKQFGDPSSYINGTWWIPGNATIISRTKPLNISGGSYA